MFNAFSEDFLIEQPAIALFSALGWETANCFDETFGPAGMLGRDTSSEVILVSRLMPALERINPPPPPPAFPPSPRKGPPPGGPVKPPPPPPRGVPVV